MSSAPNLPQIPSETTPRPTTTGRYKSHPQRDYIKHKEEYRDPYTSRGGHEFDDVEVVDVGFLEVLNWVIFIFIELLIFLVINRYVLLDAKDPYKCAALLNEGRWLESAKGPDPLFTWQPPGCLMHHYDAADITQCLPNRRMVFAGDATIKTLFYATARKLSPGNNNLFLDGEWQKDENFTAHSVSLEFIWDPYLKTDRLHDELAPWKNGAVASDHIYSYSPPAVFIIGSGIWYAQPSFNNPRREWRQALDDVLEHMYSGPRQFYKGEQDLMLLAPVPMPDWRRLNKTQKAQLDANIIVDMNRYLTYLSTTGGMDIVRSWKRTSTKPINAVIVNNTYNSYNEKAVGPDGMQILPTVADRQIDVLLNMRCNAVLSHHYPFDKTCCIKYPAPNYIQSSLIILIMTVLPFFLVAPKFSERLKFAKDMASAKVLKALFAIGLIAVLCFYADRTQVFNKSSKKWSDYGFAFGLMVAAVAAVISIWSTKNQSQDPDLLLLAEWKGAALPSYLLYQYLGASAPINTSGVSVSIILFIFAAEQTYTMLQKRYYSFKTIVKTLFRLNFTAVLLTYLMKTPYTFYRIPLLLSFWFIIIQITMRTGSLRNRSLRFFFAKLAISASAVILSFTTPPIVSNVFKFLRAVFFVDWNPKEVAPLVLTDMWSVYAGAAAAAVYFKISTGTVVGSTRNKFREYVNWTWVFTTLICIINAYLTRNTSASGLLHHTFLSLSCTSTYALIRFSNRFFRAYHSRALTWFGSCYIEILVLMNHIWMAADGRGVLDLGIWPFDYMGRFLNCAIWSVAFFYVCSSMRDASEVVTEWFVGEVKSEDGVKDGNGKVPEMQWRRKGENGLSGLEDEGGFRDVSLEKAKGELLADLRVRSGILMVVIWVLNIMTV